MAVGVGVGEVVEGVAAFVDVDVVALLVVAALVVAALVVVALVDVAVADVVAADVVDLVDVVLVGADDVVVAVPVGVAAEPAVDDGVAASAGRAGTASTDATAAVTPQRKRAERRAGSTKNPP